MIGSQEYLRVERGSAGQREHVGDVGEADVDG